MRVGRKRVVWENESCILAVVQGGGVVWIWDFGGCCSWEVEGEGSR